MAQFKSKLADGIRLSNIGKNSIVGAHALVTEGKVFPDNSLIIGMPAKVVKTLSDDEVAAIKMNFTSYVQKGKEFLEGKFES